MFSRPNKLFRSFLKEGVSIVHNGKKYRVIRWYNEGEDIVVVLYGMEIRLRPYDIVEWYHDYHKSGKRPMSRNTREQSFSDDFDEMTGETFYNEDLY